MQYASFEKCIFLDNISGLDQRRNNYCLQLLISSSIMQIYPANLYLFKFNNRNTGKRCEICSKLKTKTRTHFTPYSSVSIVESEQVNVS